MDGTAFDVGRADRVFANAVARRIEEAHTQDLTKILSYRGDSAHAAYFA